MDTGLTARDMNTLRAIFINFPEVKQVRLFGSRVKGNYKKGSDIDLAIMNPGVDHTIISKLSTAFDESSLPYFVDIFNYATLNVPLLKQHIDEAGIMVYDLHTLTKEAPELLASNE